MLLVTTYLLISQRGRERWGGGGTDLTFLAIISRNSEPSSGQQPEKETNAYLERRAMHAHQHFFFFLNIIQVVCVLSSFWGDVCVCGGGVQWGWGWVQEEGFGAKDRF